MLAIRQPINRGLHIRLDADIENLIPFIASLDCEIFTIPPEVYQGIESSEEKIMNTLESLHEEGKFTALRNL